MFNFVIGVVVGAAFAPFWMLVYTKWIRPAVTQLFGTKD